MDESFNLCDFYNKYTNNINDVSYNILQDYPNQLSNYNEIKNKLFKNNHINPQIYLSKSPLLKFKNLILINHTIYCPTFHKFPENIRQLIIKSIKQEEYITTNCFITRNIATHLNRNLSNQKDIEIFIHQLNNFSIINPENISFDTFINILQKQKLVIITWGSALTNLIYLKPNTNVIILKSQSYEHENNELFKNIFNNLNIQIIKHTNNEIDINLIINSIKSCTAN
jgi:capsular polysaccharide biosynthesis protein